MTKGRDIIIFAKSQPSFDVHRQYLDVSLLDLQAGVSRFRCRIFHFFILLILTTFSSVNSVSSK